MKSPNTATMNHVDAGAALLGETESVVVEAPTVEAALEAVVAQMGTSCQIIGVEKVSRGGIAGFFGKESYQVEVQRPQGPGIAPRTDEPQGAAAVDRVLEAAAEVQADRGPQTFATKIVRTPDGPAATWEEDAAYGNGEHATPGERHRLVMADGPWRLERSFDV